MSFFIQDLHLNFRSFLGFFQHGSGSSVKAIMSNISNITTSNWFENFLVSNSIIQSQQYLDYLSSILKIFVYQTSF